MSYSLLKTNGDNPDFHALVAQLNAHFAPLNAEADDFYAQYNKLDALKHVIVVYADAVPVACGAIKAYSTTSMEIKRMFVKPDRRGQGIASAILEALENWAQELGYSETILETLKAETHVVSIYAKNGYRITDNYGQYVGVDTSVCMKKILSDER